MSLVSISYLVRVGKTHWKGHQDPSKSVPIFLRGTEANLKMVPINGVPIPRNRTVLYDDDVYYYISPRRGNFVSREIF